MTTLTKLIEGDKVIIMSKCNPNLGSTGVVVDHHKTTVWIKMKRGLIYAKRKEVEPLVGNNTTAVC